MCLQKAALGAHPMVSSPSCFGMAIEDGRLACFVFGDSFRCVEGTKWFNHYHKSSSRTSKSQNDGGHWFAFHQEGKWEHYVFEQNP